MFLDSQTPFKSPDQVQSIGMSLDFERANPPSTFHEALRRLIPWLRILPPDFIWDFAEFHQPIITPHPDYDCKTRGCAVGVAEALWTQHNPLHYDEGARQARDDSGVAQIWTDLFIRPAFTGSVRVTLGKDEDPTKEMVADDIERYLSSLDRVT